jgi:phosphoenolpyruvate-protein kinase (PTS system EI component)
MLHFPPIHQPTLVILARDLTPSETVSLKIEQVLAFCIAEGGPTSHTAILAKALNLPAVVNLGSELLEIPGGTLLLVDGAHGMVTAAPAELTQAEFARLTDQAIARSQLEKASSARLATTQDGITLEIVANIGGRRRYSCARFRRRGVGLFRRSFCT